MVEMEKAGYDVKDIDLTSDGIDQFNPLLRDRLLVGDLFSVLEALEAGGEKFDLIVIQNVLEHLGDPDQGMVLLRKLLTPTGIGRLQVPNDGSWLHQLLEAENMIPGQYYLSYPEHLHYFNMDSIRSLVTQNGLELLEILGIFPVDLFALHPGRQ